MPDTGSPKIDKVIGVFGNRFQPGTKGKFPERPMFDDYDYVVKCMGSITGYSSGKIKFVSGGGRGIESLVEKWCLECEVPFERIRPPSRDSMEDPDGSLNAPFQIRNQQIISLSDEIVIFWDGREYGFDMLAKTAILFGKHVKYFSLSVK